jgi:hypothetical protein
LLGEFQGNPAVFLQGKLRLFPFWGFNTVDSSVMQEILLLLFSV